MNQQSDSEGSTAFVTRLFDFVGGLCLVLVGLGFLGIVDGWTAPGGIFPVVFGSIALIAGGMFLWKALLGRKG